jgi:hypothetical protein
MSSGEPDHLGPETAHDEEATGWSVMASRDEHAIIAQ